MCGGGGGLTSDSKWRGRGAEDTFFSVTLDLQKSGGRGLKLPSPSPSAGHDIFIHSLQLADSLLSHFVATASELQQIPNFYFF